MKNLITICFLLPLLFSCTPEKATISKTILINTTADTVFVRAMMNGSIDTTHSFDLAPRDSIERNLNRYPGLVKGDAFSLAITIMDSMVVYFGDRYVAVHQSNRYTGDTTRVIHYSSPRNLYNIKSYYRTVAENSKNFRSVIYYYTFNEDDIMP